MAKYSKGETSQAKLEEKQAKTQSLLNKTLLILDAVKERQSIPSLDSLKGKHGIPFKSALAWADPELNISSCSYNTSREPYNIEYSKKLAVALESYNNFLQSSTAKPITERQTKRSQTDLIVDLKGQVEYLQNAVAEIYRAYMQLMARMDEHTRQDIRYQQVIKNHTRAVNKARLTLVKP